jgi:hypothetical protein
VLEFIEKIRLLVEVLGELVGQRLAEERGELLEELRRFDRHQVALADSR